MAKYLLAGLLLFLSCTFSFDSHAQTRDSLATASPGQLKYLLLSKAGTLSRYRIHIGETITFKRFQDKGFRTETVLGIRGTSFYVSGQEVLLKDVEKIRLQNHTGGRKVASFTGSLLKAGGTIFTLVGAINFFTNLNDTSDRQDGLHTIGGAVVLYAAGEGLHALRKGTYTLNEKWTLKIIEMY